MCSNLYLRLSASVIGYMMGAIHCISNMECKPWWCTSSHSRYFGRLKKNKLNNDIQCIYGNHSSAIGYTRNILCLYIYSSFFFFTFNCSVHFVSVNMSCLQRNVLIVTSKRVDESFGTFHFLQQVNQQLLLTILVILLGATASCW